LFLLLGVEFEGSGVGPQASSCCSQPSVEVALPPAPELLGVIPLPVRTCLDQSGELPLKSCDLLSFSIHDSGQTPEIPNVRAYQSLPH
jgi:hypothetical protein